MKRDDIDLFLVEDRHLQIHALAENWADWVMVRQPMWASPMFKQAKSNSRQWAEPEYRRTCDILAAADFEKEVSKLPDLHRDVIRWFYVHRFSEKKARKQFGMTKDVLRTYLCDARTMLMNRIKNA